MGTLFSSIFYRWNSGGQRGQVTFITLQTKLSEKPNDWRKHQKTATWTNTRLGDGFLIWIQWTIELEVNPGTAGHQQSQDPNSGNLTTVCVLPSGTLPLNSVSQGLKPRLPTLNHSPRATLPLWSSNTVCQLWLIALHISSSHQCRGKKKKKGKPPFSAFMTEKNGATSVGRGKYGLGV